VLLDQRSAAYSALVAYTKDFNQASLSLLPADPIWQDLWETYADLRREAQSVIQSNKAVKWKNMLSKLQSNFENDKRHFFATIKTLKTSCLKSKPSSIISLTVPLNLAVKGADRTTTDLQEIKQILCEFHSRLCQPSSATNAFDSQFYENTTHYVQRIPNSKKYSLFFDLPPSVQETKNIVDNLVNFKAAGLDLLFNESLKIGGPLLCTSLEILFNCIWLLESTPTVWSRALIHLIPKGHDVDMLLPSSYRPVSLTSSVSKIFERVVLCRLDCYAAKEDLFPAEQAGF
jgi:hypothetical protein